MDRPTRRGSPRGGLMTAPWLKAYFSYCATSMFRALNRIGYGGPLSIEWEDSGMDRDWGAPDALAFVRRTDFAPSSVAFDAAFSRGD